MQHLVDRKKAIARTLKSVLRPYDTAYYLSSGRFALLLGSTSMDGGQAVVERVRKAAQEFPPLAGVAIRFGFAVVDPSAEGETQPQRVLELAILNLQTPAQAPQPPVLAAAANTQSDGNAVTEETSTAALY